jgi:hypothetical protein
LKAFVFGMDFIKFTQNVFAQEKRVIYLGIVDRMYRLRHSEFRQNAKILSPPDVIRDFMTITPSVIMNELEKRQPVLGLVKVVLVRYEKRVLLFGRFQEYVIILGFDPEVPTPFPDQMFNIIKTAADKS